MILPIMTKGLKKSFGQIAALKGLNLQTLRGVSGFVGPNGAGKTTTINILLGLLKPDAGEARIFDMDCWRDSFEIRRRIGVLHEKPTYPGNFQGKRYLEHVADVYDISQPKQRVKEILGEVGLHEVGDRAIRTYSAGMTQRLGLAQALIGDPELVILDEPTANLDPLGRIEIIEKIRELQTSRRIDFFVSTHILPELEKICDWVSIVKDGIIVDQGSVEHLATKYSANTFKIEVSEPSLFVGKIQDSKVVDEVWVQGDSVYCKVKNIDDFYRQVPQIISELKIELRSLQSSYNTLEEIFKAAIGGKRQ